MVTPVSRTFLNPTLSINGVSALRKDRKLAGGDMLFNNYRYAVETVRKVRVVYNARGLQLITQNDEVLGVWVENRRQETGC